MSKEFNENLIVRLGDVPGRGGEDGEEDDTASTAELPATGSRSRPSADAFDYALNLLSRQMHSVGQLRTKLTSKKYTKAEADDALARLVELKFLDDANFASVYLENLKAHKSYGFYGIQKKLYERQLAKPLVEKTMRGFGVDDELAIAKRFLDRQYGDVRSNREKLQRMLHNRGFRTEVIFKAVKGN